ncbi:heme peroxidase [Amylocarpus encephaloides]|uniref:Heme peroxidase n=1 Tax=Amylocarpus encephaloides TaxID=45428 RepID=A0A9P8C7A4_9HELO|nr:heme peroxidase [Amylocarpus encephaloides]
MKLAYTLFKWPLVCSRLVLAAPTWPAAIDELEDVMVLNTGYKSRGFSSHITPCSFSEFGVGRQTAAEWLRIGFHDMATTNVFFEPHGGIDGSIAFELQSGENIGAGFATSLTTYSSFFNTRLSISDLIALGVHASVRGCGGPVVPMRGGRTDATGAGPIGVPQPQNGQGVFVNQFTRMGFSIPDMIQMTACGHAIGGVHAGNFPEIVPVGSAPNDYHLFDTTLEFDNLIAVQYLNGPVSDPLSVGISVMNTRNSDFVVFNTDKNVTIKAMTGAPTFSSVCSSILQRMIETVPLNVQLSDVIAPYEVKPSGIQLTLLAGGTQIAFSGDIRVRTTTRTVSSVTITYKNRTGGAGGTITTTVAGTASGFDDSFTFYGFSSNIPAVSSISSFTVTVAETDGLTTTFSNNGGGFPVQDDVMVLGPQSCLSNGNLTVLAAVRSTAATPTLGITQKVPRAAATPVPSLAKATAAMVKGATVGPYDIYSASYIISSATGTKFGVSSGPSADDFKDASSLDSTCVPLGSSDPSSTSSSSTVSSTTSTSSTSKSSMSTTSTSSTSTSESVSTTSTSSTSSSTSATPTLGHKPIVGSYTFQGCYTEGTGMRALTGAVFYDYPAMTLEMCATNCAGFTYWGVEYGGECFCGNSLAPSSTLANLNDCNFICPGSQVEYCGAGNRLELYQLTSSTSSTSLSSSSSSSTVSSTSTSQSTTSTTAESSTSPTVAPTPSIVPSVGSYHYAGCYTEPSGVRALSSAFYPTDAQTIELCIAACGQTPYMYAGAEYGRECWCANAFSAGSNLVGDGDCSMVCAGNQLQYCGAGNRLSVYIRNGTTT